VECRRRQIHVVLIPAPQERKHDQIDGEADAADPKHRRCVHGQRCSQSLQCLKGDPGDDKQQSATIDECCKHAQALIAKRALRIRRPRCDACRSPRKCECSGIREHVARIGEQRQ
jgi:hypothetical protein